MKVGSRGARSSFLQGVVLGCSIVTGAAGCELGGQPEDHQASSQAATSGNGLSLNGLSLNGLSLNGLSLNGLSLNGLSLNGLAAGALASNGTFKSWFNQDPPLRDESMTYLVRCALAAGHSTSFVDASNVVHTWPGALGLADSWLTSGPSVAQKAWVSSCLMAHVNNALPAPKQIQLSIRGEAPSLATSPIEVAALKTFDGIYFGDLFAAKPEMFICKNGADTLEKQLLTEWGRLCGFDGCQIFTKVKCDGVCAKLPGSTTFGSKCTYNGKTYSGISAYVPDFRAASSWILSNGAKKTGSCSNCLAGEAITALSSTATTAAKVEGWITVAGNYRLGIRYTAPTTSNLWLHVIGQTTSATYLSFPPTANPETWNTLQVLVAIPAGATLSLGSPGAGKATPNFDVVSLQVAP